jgi:hypothetical protein
MAFLLPVMDGPEQQRHLAYKPLFNMEALSREHP